MPGRTHGQHALPVTFGYKTAVWLAEAERHRQRIQQPRPRLLVGQFGGAAGTLASLGEQALPVQTRLMQILGLGTPVITWHTARDNLAEFAGWTALVCASLGKMALEIIELERTELAEVEEPWTEGKVGSSTMPHKRNPMLCEAILALARLVLRLAPAGLDAMVQSGERDWSADHVEWAYLPEVCIYTDGALNLTARVLGGLHVYPERMRRNLELTGGQILSEAVMLALAEKTGRQSAHEAVYECAQRAYREGLPFAQVLAQDPAVAPHLTGARITELLDPGRYTGLAGVFVDRVVAGAAGEPYTTPDQEEI
jgi:adenylosuccinate lyase